MSHLINNITPVEFEVLRYVKKGLSSTQIAELRNCSPRTIEKHRSNVIKKLGIPPTQNALLIWTIEYLENT